MRKVLRNHNLETMNLLHDAYDIDPNLGKWLRRLEVKDSLKQQEAELKSQILVVQTTIKEVEEQMIPQFMHVKQIAAKDTVITEKDAALTKQKDTLTVQELTIKQLTIHSLRADIEDLKVAYEEEIESLRQRWEMEANQCQCQKEGHSECQDSGWKLRGSIGMTAFNLCLFVPKIPFAIQDAKITLANVTVNIANKDVTTAYEGATLKDLKEFVKDQEDKHGQKADSVSAALYMDTLTFKREIEWHRRAIKAYLQGDDEAEDARSYICYGCVGSPRVPA
ncbi:hypothetical protein N0V86_003735 [Didymella sp. IMI 355093]|nr:hypothetical protein N0V86_003735 [Didymella sp. IMI 355093]